MKPLFIFVCCFCLSPTIPPLPNFISHQLYFSSIFVFSDDIPCRHICIGCLKRIGLETKYHVIITLWKENAFSFQQQKLSINMIQSKILLFHWAKTITTEDKSSHFIELDKFMFKKLQLITRSGFLSSKVEMFTTKSLDKIPWQKWNEVKCTQNSANILKCFKQ